MRGLKTGSYTLVEEIGEGGMGKVYLAEHALMGKRAAVKVLLPELSSDEELVNRFFNEARAATRVSHSGIVDVYDFGYTDEGRAYIVMELLEGEPLSALIAREAPLAADRVARLGVQVADALAAAHEAGIIHRDLKPDNVFLVRDAAVAGGERAKILDFGIAKLGGDNKVSLKTRTGALMGTPTYMSPEQCRGSAELDWRSDIYSAACILFELIAGRPPFVAQGLGELLAEHMMTPPPSATEFVPSAPPELVAILAKMLEKDPARRPQSMREVVAVLAPLTGSTLPPDLAMPAMPAMTAMTAQRVATEPTTLGGAAGVREPTLPRPRHRLALLIGTAVAVIALVVAAAVVLTGGGHEELRAATQPPVETDAMAAVASVSPGEIDAGAAIAEEPADAAPAAPARVVIRLDSNPTAAAVFAAGSGERLGTTPFEQEVERGEGELRLVLKRRGHRDREVRIPRAEDAELRVDLERIRTPARQPSGEPDRGGQRGWGDILD
jgi:eukaryotic-like serine/threonine-protein kinase